MDEGSIVSLFVKVDFENGSNVVVGVVYLPRGDFKRCENLLADICSIYSNEVIVDDFNTDFEKEIKLGTFGMD